MARSRADGASTVLLAPILLVIVAACSSAPAPSAAASGTPPTSGPGPAASADTGAVEAAGALLAAAKLGDEASLQQLEAIRFTAAGTEAARAALAASASGEALWIATYVYASSATDPAPLTVLVTDTAASASVRAIAAAGLIGLGDAGGFDPLVAALSDSERMDGLEPIGAIWEFASDVLERTTGAGFGPALEATEAERGTIQAQWQAWLETNRASLQFDAATRVWSVR